MKKIIISGIVIVSLFIGIVVSASFNSTVLPDENVTIFDSNNLTRRNMEFIKIIDPTDRYNVCFISTIRTSSGAVASSNISCVNLK
jgi:hypothetical protein